MSFWNPEKTYAPDAVHTITLKATDGQQFRWGAAAQRYSPKGSRGAFMAWAIDLAICFLEAKEKTDEERRQGLQLWIHHRD